MLQQLLCCMLNPYICYYLTPLNLAIFMYNSHITAGKALCACNDFKMMNVYQRLKNLLWTGSSMMISGEAL